MSSHQARHPIEVSNDATCRACGGAVVRVEDVSRVSAHWRHKPSGYHRGDAVKRRLAARIEARVLALETVTGTLDGGEPFDSGYFDKATVLAIIREEAARP